MKGSRLVIMNGVSHVMHYVDEADDRGLVGDGGDQTKVMAVGGRVVAVGDLDVSLVGVGQQV